MKRIAMCVLVAVGCVVVSAADIPPPRAVDVAALVKQLGSAEFAEREAATERLSTLRVDEVPPELLAALKSANPEVRERAERAVKSLRERIALRRLPRGERFAKRGQIDLYVASTATSYTDAKADDPRLWNPVLHIGRAAMKQAGPSAPRNGVALCQDISEYKKGLRVWFTRVGETYTKHRYTHPEAIQASAVTGEEGFNLHIVVSRGPVRTNGNIYESVVLATGDVTVKYSIGNAVIICAGDVRAGHDVHKSLIIARGGISIKNISSTNTLIAGGTVTVGKPPVPRHGPEETDPEILKAWEVERGITEEKARTPLGYITFFELHRIGLGVRAADGAVQVTKITAGQPCDKAGLKVGDTILEVNGKKPTDAESLRRLLRDALAIGDASVKLQRGDKAETVKVSLPE
jgi:hypothetical protein